MKKRIFLLALCAILVFGCAATPALAASGRDVRLENGLTADLKELGLFKGVSDTNFDLERAPSRVEALVMLIRMLGKEQQALASGWSHPFTDVPKWADPYVGYAYENGLTKGVSATEFGTQAASAEMFLTFVLRALGYSDAGGVDFTWNDPYTLAAQIGILPDCVQTAAFWRADAVAVSYAALSVYCKDSEQTLADKLIAAGVFTETQYEDVYRADAFLTQASMQDTAQPEAKQSTATASTTQDTAAGENFHGKIYTGGAYSKRYHYEADCAGKNSHEITWEEVKRRGLTACSKCAEQ